jgi:hypothetical protein
MPQETAHAFALDLARTLMTNVIVFEADAQFGVVETSEYDGDPDRIVQEYDPFAP